MSRTSKTPSPSFSHKVNSFNNTKYPRNEEPSLAWNGALIAFVAFMAYANSLGCGFAFDDMSAIRDNVDIRPQTAWTQLFFNDFWGTPIKKEQSHKSYRPLCVLTFRLNYLIHELDPMGYHLFNVVLHIIVCLLYHRMCNIFMPRTASLVAALLFAVHPIHSEAVTGVVGRAETLSSVFFLLAVMSYIKASNHRKRTAWFWMVMSIFCVALATLSKEQGITAVAICCLYEVFIAQKVKILDLIHIIQALIASKATLPNWLKESLLRITVLAASTIVMLMARLKIMGSTLPVFTKFDNPASGIDTPYRQLTFNYLLAVNAKLLLFPCNLCCDWTMGSIAVIESFLDPRNLETILFYIIFAVLFWFTLRMNDGITEHVLVMSLSFIVCPFIPASNLLFYVGFVVAERVLYMPSMGFCMLIAYGWYIIYEKISDYNNNDKHKEFSRKFVVSALLLLLFLYLVKTVRRNSDWKSEYTIFMAGLKVTQKNAKLYNNVGHALESQLRYQEALEYFIKAVEVQPDDIGAHMNVGRTYNNLNLFEEAEKAFRRAKNLLPRPRAGERYQARVAPSHLNVFINLANLISRNKSRLEEADVLYRQAISMRADYTQAYINRGDILIKLNRTKDAQEVYEKALQFDKNNPDIYYNVSKPLGFPNTNVNNSSQLGVVLLEQGKSIQALVYFNKALEIDPSHEPALMNSAILIQESGDSNLRSIAKYRLNKLIENGKANERVYFNLGMLAMDAKDYLDGEKWFRAAINVKEDFRSALFNLALLLSDSNRPLEAVPFLKQLLKYHPDHIKGLILLGDIYINHVKELDLAEECYKKIVSLEPTNVQGQHNLCVVYVERGQLNEAEKCLLNVAALAPSEDYVKKHLTIVRNRIIKLKNKL